MQAQMQEEQLRRQEESTAKQEAARRSNEVFCSQTVNIKE